MRLSLKFPLNPLPKAAIWRFDGLVICNEPTETIAQYVAEAVPSKLAGCTAPNFAKFNPYLACCELDAPRALFTFIFIWNIEPSVV